MPHIVLECSRNISELCTTDTLIKEIYKGSVTADLFNPSAIKTRIVFYDDYLIGDYENLRQGYFTHLTITMLAGRDIEQKELLKEHLYNCLANIFSESDDVHFSVRVADVEKAAYKKS